MKQQNLSAVVHLRHRFDADLQAFTAVQIAGGKAKSLKTAYGTLGFRTSPGKIEAIDETAAIEWANRHAPDAVKRDPKLYVSSLKGHEADLPTDIFTITEKHESFYISTGAAKAGGAAKGGE